MALTVLVLFGGVSTEHIISLRSAYNIISGLRAAGFKVQKAGITQQGEWLAQHGPDEEILENKWQDAAQRAAAQAEPYPVRSPRDLILSVCEKEPDCIFPAVHGINCEDGALQGLLTLAGFPFVGCGVLASAACMDKAHARKIFSQAGLPQCRYLVLDRQQIEQEVAAVVRQVEEEIGFPCFLKPNNGGSSVGTSKVASKAELARELLAVSRFDQKVMVEEFIKGREIEVSVLGRLDVKTGALGEIVAKEAAYYDYHAKYFSKDGADVMVPARLPADLADQIEKLAVKAYQAIGCSGLARVDFFLTVDDAVYLNEINTLPGFTSISVYPKAFAAKGLELPELVSQLCQLAITEKKLAQRLESI